MAQPDAARQALTSFRVRGCGGVTASLLAFRMIGLGGHKHSCTTAAMHSPGTALCCGYLSCRRAWLSRATAKNSNPPLIDANDVSVSFLFIVASNFSSFLMESFFFQKKIAQIRRIQLAKHPSFEVTVKKSPCENRRSSASAQARHY